MPNLCSGRFEAFARGIPETISCGDHRTCGCAGIGILWAEIRRNRCLGTVVFACGGSAAGRVEENDKGVEARRQTAVYGTTRGGAVEGCDDTIRVSFAREKSVPPDSAKRGFGFRTRAERRGGKPLLSRFEGVTQDSVKTAKQNIKRTLTQGRDRAATIFTSPKARRFRREKAKGEKRFVKTKLLLGAVVATGIGLLRRDRSASAGEALNGHEFLVDETRRQRPGRWQQSQDQADLPDCSGRRGGCAGHGPNARSGECGGQDTLPRSGERVDCERNYGGPAKLEGIALGLDVESKGMTLHTLWVANDNDFLRDPKRGRHGSEPVLCVWIQGSRTAWGRCWCCSSRKARQRRTEKTVSAKKAV